MSPAERTKSSPKGICGATIEEGMIELDGSGLLPGGPWEEAQQGVQARPPHQGAPPRVNPARPANPTRPLAGGNPTGQQQVERRRRPSVAGHGGGQGAASGGKGPGKGQPDKGAVKGQPDRVAGKGQTGRAGGKGQTGRAAGRGADAEEEEEEQE